MSSVSLVGRNKHLYGKLRVKIVAVIKRQKKEENYSSFENIFNRKVDSLISVPVAQRSLKRRF